MKARIKQVIAVFVICLILIPTVLVVAAEMKVQSVAQMTMQKQIPRRLKVVPQEMNIPKGISEDIFKNLLEVEVGYKGIKETQLITDYGTNYNEIKDEVGSHTVLISYEEDGKLVKTKICVQIIEPNDGESLKQFAYISGYADKTFKPQKPITRGELATMLARLLTDDKVPEEANTLADLSPEHYSTNSVNYVTKLGVMSSYLDGTFKPRCPITWEEFNNIIQKLEPYVGEGKQLKTKENGDVTRAESVMVLNELFNRNYIDTTNVENPYTDLKPDNPAYQDILCASIVQEE